LKKDLNKKRIVDIAAFYDWYKGMAYQKNNQGQ